MSVIFKVMAYGQGNLYMSRENRIIKNAVVTGPTGVLGTALVKKLSESGVETFAVCRPQSTRIGRIVKNDNVHIVECDVNDIKSLADKIGHEVDAFYHLAWQGTNNRANRFDMYLQNENVKCTLDAVESAHMMNCNVFVGAGSQAEYGCDGVLGSDTPCIPVSGYGMAKLCAGQMTRVICREYGMVHIWPRILSVYGENDGAGTLISTVINSLLEGETPELTKCEQVWDYLFSDDAAEAFMQMAEAGRDGAVYTLGSGKTKTLKDYVNIIRNIINPNAEIKFGAREYNRDQVMHLEADTSILEKDTGWFARTEFEQGIKSIISRYKYLNV